MSTTEAEIVVVGGGSAGLSAALTLSRARRRVIVIDSARTVLLATGTRDQLPDIPGLAARWGLDVFHCPYCHGWEIRDQRIGVLATGPMSALQALMFSQWSSDVQFLSQGLDYSPGDLAKLTVAGIRVDTRSITGLDIQDDQLTGVHLEEGSGVALDALVVPAATQARLDGLDGLGGEVSESPAGTAVTVDAAGHTNMPGVWAAGNLTQPAAQVGESAANGARVAMTMNTELIFQDANRALAEMENHR